MISRIEARNYKCLRSVTQHLRPFQILVGPNASGKTTFLDVVSFLSDMVTEGLDAAIEARTENFDDLTWMRTGEPFELAVEAVTPESLRPKLARPDWERLRYEIKIGIDEETSQTAILYERVHLRTARNSVVKKRPGTIVGNYTTGGRAIVGKSDGGNASYRSEVNLIRPGDWISSFRLGTRKSALASIPEDETIFPVTTWFKRLLAEDTQRLVLNSASMRKPSPRGKGYSFRPDGSSIPWVVRHLQETSPERFQWWIEQLRTSLPDLKTVNTVERPEDRSLYLSLEYDNGLRVPAWMASDGTLRMLALTLLAYQQESTGIVLVEEPENGIHPQAVETVFQSLSSVYDSQVFIATHSPVMLSSAEPSQVLIFSKADSGETQVVSGEEHPLLKDWQHDVNLGVLFARGILG